MDNINVKMGIKNIKIAGQNCRQLESHFLSMHLKTERFVGQRDSQFLWGSVWEYETRIEWELREKCLKAGV
ncbi:hypothetical protein D9X91_16990 [Falsibacillus albus]|uniref:Uncharacterized protein n=1 Tax=Falsibacillus albus TaxID=2478915 RepID=A0A3L7JS43_9BACI|nr:hypothetical protein D9X91_16990 [Falsibacillus albus]